MNDEAGLNFGEQGLYLFERSDASAMIVSAFDLVAGWIPTHDMDRGPGRALHEGVDDMVSHKSTPSYNEDASPRHVVDLMCKTGLEKEWKTWFDNLKAAKDAAAALFERRVRIDCLKIAIIRSHGMHELDDFPGVSYICRAKI